MYCMWQLMSSNHNWGRSGKTVIEPMTAADEMPTVLAFLCGLGGIACLLRIERIENLSNGMGS